MWSRNVPKLITNSDPLAPILMNKSPRPSRGPPTRRRPATFVLQSPPTIDRKRPSRTCSVRLAPPSIAGSHIWRTARLTVARWCGGPVAWLCGSCRSVCAGVCGRGGTGRGFRWPVNGPPRGVGPTIGSLQASEGVRHMRVPPGTRVARSRRRRVVTRCCSWGWLARNRPGRRSGIVACRRGGRSADAVSNRTTATHAAERRALVRGTRGMRAGVCRRWRVATGSIQRRGCRCGPSARRSLRTAMFAGRCEPPRVFWRL